MASHGDESKTLRKLLEEDVDEVMGYENDTNFSGSNGSPLATITGEEDSRHEPNPLPERGAADMLTALRRTLDLSSTATVINLLNEQQQRIVEREVSAKRMYKTKARLRGQRQHAFKPQSVEECLKEVACRSLSGWATGPKATTHEDIAARTALHQRYLEPNKMTLV